MEQSDRALLVSLCHTYGSQLKSGQIDGPTLLWAISGRETVFGQNNIPRHEDAYCYDGKYYRANTPGAKQLQALTEQFGCWAHCSYGPWQVLLVNCLPGVTPIELQSNPERSAPSVVANLNWFFEHYHVTSVEGAALCWNSGHWTQGMPGDDYSDHVLTNYEAGMPV